VARIWDEPGEDFSEWLKREKNKSEIPGYNSEQLENFEK